MLDVLIIAASTSFFLDLSKVNVGDSIVAIEDLGNFFKSRSPDSPLVSRLARKDLIRGQ